MRKTDAQEQCWRLLSARRVTMLWRVRWWIFLRTHRGQSFTVFRPEEIARAYSEDVQAWLICPGGQ